MTYLPFINIRPATEADIRFIIDIQLSMALETEQLRLEPHLVEKGVKAVFNDSGRGFYLLAEAGGFRAGCLMVTPEWSDWRNAWVWWLQSVYVLPVNRKSGIFGMMYDYVKNMVMQRADVSGVRLYVDRTNLRAQQAYTRVGMNGEHYSTFEWMKES